MIAWHVPMFLAGLAVVQPPSHGAGELDQLRDRIARDMQSVEKRLKDKDPGEDTRNLQKQILENLDQLLEQVTKPPPQSNDSQSQPAGGSSPMNRPSPSETKSGGTSPQLQSQSMSRRERREALRRQEQRARSGEQAADRTSQKKSTSANSPTGDGNSIPTSSSPVGMGPSDSLADVAKDIWGHLPETMRQEIDHYYRERFMPRYRDLLQQYYLRLAETERRPGGRKP